jgi:hypothetical protein
MLDGGIVKRQRTRHLLLGKFDREKLERTMDKSITTETHEVITESKEKATIRFKSFESLRTRLVADGRVSSCEATKKLIPQVKKVKRLTHNRLI